ncbi:hypothetical protein E3Q13_00615 [Wallemia mellicola]|uniref:Uncharacterized protein n=1 Tax=Wallemia mellicola TaxID=1708541 RepID=A0A4T0TM99_9BASI|nr:hypothetical protein E3Q14_01186 [Wallemia mellicola]TIC20300.1 hypothetical protein E3Q13_00615 [Wallemia mellicola]TIC35905.1 hypothetical protein E3Q09_01815 [Wallemia mellicola]TIC66024.1 hypothetical protein E3Q02_01976 [Wallemia mellicola]
MNVFQLDQKHELYKFNNNLQSLPRTHINHLKISLLRLRSFYLYLLDDVDYNTLEDAITTVRHWELSVGIPAVDFNFSDKKYTSKSLNAHLELLDEIQILVDNYSNIHSVSIPAFNRTRSNGNTTGSSTGTTNNRTSTTNNSNSASQAAQTAQQQRNDSYVVINLSTIIPLILPLLFLVLKCFLMLYIFCRHGTWPRKLILATLTIGYSIWEATRFVHIRRHTISPQAQRQENNNNNNNGVNQENQANQANNENAYDALNRAAQMALNNPSNHIQTISLNPFERLLDYLAHMNLEYEARRLRIPGPVASSQPLPPLPQTRSGHGSRPQRQPLWYTRIVIPVSICILTLVPEIERRRSRALKWRYNAFKNIKATERERRERERVNGDENGGLRSPQMSTSPVTADNEDERVAEDTQVDHWEE